METLLPSALKALFAVYCLSLLSWMVLALKLTLEVHILIIAAAILALIFGFVLFGLARHQHERFGYANLVTAIRAGIVSLVGATVVFSSSFGHQQPDMLIWCIVFAVVFAFALDGVDGYLARRFGEQSELGARFDMEVDALLILILSVAATLLDKAGPWVMFVGLMRYLFVTAQWLFPSLRRDLPHSFRRKLICVIQVAVLCGVLSPLIIQPWSGWMCALALLLLIYSFAVDCLWLIAGKEEAKQ